MKVRRAGTLVSYWTEAGLVICNYARGKSVLADSLVAHVLNLCGRWISATELQHRLSDMRKDSIDSLLRSMLRHSLLVRAGDPEDRSERALRSWAHWNPAAGFYHLSTKNMPVPANGEAGERRLQAERETRGCPERVKRYPRALNVSLPSPRKDGEFADVLLARRTWRSFAADAVELTDISTLLALTWGVQREAQSPTSGLVHLKTSPSSGARQPLEGYLLAVRVNGLRPGLYHYVADRHRLEFIKKGATSKTIAKYIPGQWWYERAAALFMMTAVFARTQWRYRFPRAYRSVLFEAGHVCQTFCLVATWLGLAPFCTGRFADARVEGDIGADGVTESFVYGAGVGRRPDGVDWAPWPLDASAEHPLMRPGGDRKTRELLSPE